jgi:hypothetical protein
MFAIHDFTNRTPHFSTISLKAPASIKKIFDLPKSEHFAQTYQQHTKLYKFYPQFNLTFPHKLALEFYKKIKCGSRIRKTILTSNNLLSKLLTTTNMWLIYFYEHTFRFVKMTNNALLNLQNVTSQINAQPTVANIKLWTSNNSESISTQNNQSVAHTF